LCRGIPSSVPPPTGTPAAWNREIELYVEAGLTPMDALQAATIVPARALKMDGELGTIERGKRADMVVLNVNPLDSIRNIRSVRAIVEATKRGVRYDGDPRTLQRVQPV
jgi:imidazolonepropionase-like amidohydrolase